MIEALLVAVVVYGGIAVIVGAVLASIIGPMGLFVAPFWLPALIYGLLSDGK